MLKHYAHHGGFNEYNSPGYAIAGLHWCEWMHQFVTDAVVQNHAEGLRTLTWHDYANHFHPATGQLAGPQSRAYQDRLPAQIVAYLRQQTGVCLPWRGADADLEPYLSNPQPALFSYVKPLPCPADLAGRFRDLPQSPLELRHPFIRRDSKEGSVVGTTWFSADACLGSINRDNLWVQRRPLLGYWRTPDDPAVCLRLQFLKDGVDFASAYVSNAQVGRRVLSAFNLLTHKGDWHDHIDRPSEKGCFEAHDFRVRYALAGRGVSGAELSDKRFELIAGERRAVVHAASGHLGPHAIEWRLGQDGQGDEAHVYVDAICYRGARREFRFAELGEIVIAAGVELLKAGVAPSCAPIQTVKQFTDRLDVKWPAAPGLELHAPLKAGPHPCSI